MTNMPPLARYRFTAQMQAPIRLPAYAGSLLRGQLGAALRNVACMTRQPSCPGCPLLQTCPYSRIFEAPAPAKGQHTLQNFSQIPNPYIIEPPIAALHPSHMPELAEGEILEFNLVLVGDALEQLALLIFALQRALNQGLTRQRAPATLLQVDWLDHQNTAHRIWTQQQPTITSHPAVLVIPPAPVTDSFTLDIHTPMRLQQQGKPLGVSQLTPRTLIAALARRSALLFEFHAAQKNWGEAARQAAQTSENLADSRNLRWFDWTRYSSRQHQEMTLGGVVGQWQLHGDAEIMAQLWPWLWLGQWLHVGKNASMGLGGYTLAN